MGRRLASELHATDFGILCLAEETVEKPWILFEAGALSKAVETSPRVVPYLLFGLDHHELPEPLRQFQSVSADRKGTLKLVQSVNSFLPDTKKLPEHLLDETFAKTWPELKDVLQHARNAAGQPWRNLFVYGTPSVYDQYLANAKEVWLFGVTLENTLSTYKEPLKDRLRDQCKLRVLLSVSERSVIEPAVLRKSSDEAITGRIILKRAEIEVSKATLREIRGVLGQTGQAGVQHEEQLQIHTTRYPLAYGAHVMDPNKPWGVLYIKFYPFRVQSEQKPKLVLRADRDQDYKWFLQELDALWKAGEEIDLDQSSA